MKIFEIIVEQGQGGQRMDIFLPSKIPYSRSFLQKCIKQGLVTINDKPCTASRMLSTGDRVCTKIPDPTPLSIQAEVIPLEILYEDSDLIVINKASGMVVHPGAGNWEHTLVNALLAHCGKSLSGIGGVERPGIVHRLDKDTSGCLIVAKNDLAHQNLVKAFQSRSLEKVYRVLVWGRVNPDRFDIDLPIGRHPNNRQKMAIAQSGGKNALTHVSVLKRFTHYSYLECRISTGRTHQIRVHLSSQSHPVLGDKLYGKAKLNNPYANPDRQMLHAFRLAFDHPRTGKKLEFIAPLPGDFLTILGDLS
ncbi:MAG: RluA family pseudouridine synthase [Verrucomicrobiota bacterium]|nr:RluA family pseudouridine synthase [Verrucomicrobiota bacterium]